MKPLRLPALNDEFIQRFLRPVAALRWVDSFIYGEIAVCSEVKAATLLAVNSAGDTRLFDSWSVVHDARYCALQRRVYSLSSNSIEQILPRRRQRIVASWRRNVLERGTSDQPGILTLPTREFYAGRLLGLFTVLIARSVHLELQTSTWRLDPARDVPEFALPSYAGISDSYFVVRRQTVNQTDTEVFLFAIDDMAQLLKVRRIIHRLIRVLLRTGWPPTIQILVWAKTAEIELALRARLAEFDSGLEPFFWTTNGTLVPLDSDSSGQTKPGNAAFRLGHAVWCHGWVRLLSRVTWAPIQPPEIPLTASEEPTLPEVQLDGVAIPEADKPAAPVTPAQGGSSSFLFAVRRTLRSVGRLLVRGLEARITRSPSPR